jgi:predicted P-loop ATPase
MAQRKAPASAIGAAEGGVGASILPAGTGFRPSGKTNPCPICGRVKDGSCSISDGLVLCHHGSSHYPPDGLKAGDTHHGIDGRLWAYCGESNDGRTAIYKPHEERRPATRQAQKPQLVEPTTAPPISRDKPHWKYSPTFYVVRADKPDGTKTFSQLSCVDGTWLWKAPVGKRPLLLSRQLSDEPNAPVLVVEGEKTWDAAQRLFPDLIACCWSGGCKAIAKTDFTPLAGRKVVLWPDNDAAGRAAMNKVAQLLHSINAASVELIANPDDAPQGWDIADADWDASQAAEWLKDNATTIKQAISSKVSHRDTYPVEATSGSYSKPITMQTHQVMERLPKRVGKLRLNVRSGEVVADHIDGPIILSGNDIGRLYLDISSQAEKWPKETTADAVALLASRNKYDPVKDYLDGNPDAPLPIDQWQRLDKYLLGIDDPIAAAFLPRYFIGAVARTYQPGCYVRQSPVLIGRQERGKSELGRILFGADHWVEGIGTLDKDALMKAHTAWGVELAELDGVTRRADQEALKAFLTEKTDTYRKPYDRAPEVHHRRFVFWGTSNGAPLKDPTGSTRFVCIPIPNQLLPLNWARQNRNALWSRAVEQYKAGANWIHVDEAERAAIADRNSNFQEIDPWADDVAAYLDLQKRLGSLPVRVTQVLERLEVPKERQNSAATKRVTAIADQLGWSHGRRRGANSANPCRGLWPTEVVPPVPPLCPPTGVRVNSSDSRASEGVVPPVPPDSPKLKKVGTEHEPAAAPAPPGTTTDTFGAFWGHSVHTAETGCAGWDVSPMVGGTEGGTDRKTHEQRIRELGHSTDLRGWSDDEVADLVQSLEQAARRQAGSGLFGQEVA